MTVESDPGMRPSRVLRQLRAGRVARCFKMNLDTSRAVEIVSRTGGFDCIWLDMEHVPNDWSLIERQILAAKFHDTDIMVRVSRGGYSDYIKALELDAAGVMVPHLMSAADAKQVVRMTRFHPLGRRPVDGGNADGAFCAIPFQAYLRQANRERFLVCQIEDPEPLEELEAIASVEGLDMLFFGPGDFSQGIGAPGEWEHPRLLEAQRRVAETARAHGKFAGTVCSPESAARMVDLGYTFLSFGADVVGMRQYALDLTRRFNEMVPDRAGPVPVAAEMTNPYARKG
jgi:4-hydroxy-2-oxoheptanedioate aldolase